MHLLLCSCLFFCFNPHAGSTFASAFKRVCCTNYSCVYDVLIVLLLHVYFTIITLFGDRIIYLCPRTGVVESRWTAPAVGSAVYRRGTHLTPWLRPNTLKRWHCRYIHTCLCLLTCVPLTITWICGSYVYIMHYTYCLLIMQNSSLKHFQVKMSC